MTERLSSFEQIAENEKLAERHVRFLAPLAYLSPRILDFIAEGRAPADLTVSRLARKLPMSWKDQERQLALRLTKQLLRCTIRDVSPANAIAFRQREIRRFENLHWRPRGEKGPNRPFSTGLRSPKLILGRNPPEIRALLHTPQVVSETRDWRAGAGGFEPPYGGIKIRCLTAWRRPSAAPQESRVPRRGGP